MARESNARLIGIDASSIAVAQARARADDLELSSTATFSTGYFERDDITKNRGK